MHAPGSIDVNAFAVPKGLLSAHGEHVPGCSLAVNKMGQNGVYGILALTNLPSLRKAGSSSSSGTITMLASLASFISAGDCCIANAILPAGRTRNAHTRTLARIEEGPRLQIKTSILPEECR